MNQVERVARVLAAHAYKDPDVLVYRGATGEQWATWNEYVLEAEKYIAVYEAILGETT